MPSVIDSLIKIVETQEHVHHQFEPLSKAIAAIENSQTSQAFKQLQQLTRVAFRPFDEIRRVSHLQCDVELRQIRKLITATESRFCLPRIGEATKLLCEFKNSSLGNTMRRYETQASKLSQAMEAMRATLAGHGRQVAVHRRLREITKYRTCAPHNASLWLRSDICASDRPRRLAQKVALAFRDLYRPTGPLFILRRTRVKSSLNEFPDQRIRTNYRYCRSQSDAVSCGLPI